VSLRVGCLNIVEVIVIVKLNGKELQFVVEFKYLGHILLHNMSDSVDMEREIRNMFFRANILVRKFSQCSTAVKVQFSCLNHIVLICMAQHCGTNTLPELLVVCSPVIINA